MIDSSSESERDRVCFSSSRFEDLRYEVVDTKNRKPSPDRCGLWGDREVDWIPAVLMPERAQLVDVEG